MKLRIIVFLFWGLIFCFFSCDKQDNHIQEHYVVNVSTSYADAGEVECTYISDSLVELKAVPSAHWKFNRWNGDIKGNENPKKVNLTQNIIAKAIFTPDLTLPSIYLKKLYYNWDFPYGWSHHFVSADYNSDGYPDIVYCPLNNMVPTRSHIEFYLGNASGIFVPDEKNNKRILGQIWPRKQICGDYNGDGIMDICMFGHGWDAPPWPGEYIIILMSSPQGVYNDLRLTDYIGYFHGGASADIDNDGDLDIVAISSWISRSIFLLNDGKGNFTPDYDIIHQGLANGMYNTDLWDIDKDGYIDLIMGGHDHEGPFIYDDGQVAYNNTPIVFWGDGNTFNTENYTRLPECKVKGMGVVVDFEVFDVDGDGIDEIIVSRTGDGMFEIPFYNGWAIQVIKRNSRTFEDVTDKVMSFESSYKLTGSWFAWMDVEKLSDGRTSLMARFDNNAQMLFVFQNNRMQRN